MKPPSITNSVPVTVAAYEKALAEGVGAVTVDGKMIDVPIVERARLLLERETAIADREKMREAAAMS